MPNELMLAYLEQAQAIERLIMESDGEITPEIEAMLSAVDLKGNAAIESFIWTKERLELARAHIEAKMGQLHRIQKGLSKALSLQSESLKMWMDLNGLDRLEGQEQTIYFKKSPPSVLIEDEGQIPEEFFKVKKELSRQAIQQAIREGEKVPGAKLIQNKHLAYRASGPSVAIRDVESKPEALNGKSTS